MTLVRAGFRTGGGAERENNGQTGEGRGGGEMEGVSEMNEAEERWTGR